MNQHPGALHTGQTGPVLIPPSTRKTRDRRACNRWRWAEVESNGTRLAPGRYATDSCVGLRDSVHRPKTVRTVTSRSQGLRNTRKRVDGGTLSASRSRPSPNRDVPRQPAIDRKPTGAAQGNPTRPDVVPPTPADEAPRRYERDTRAELVQRGHRLVHQPSESSQSATSMTAVPTL
jgi:hypothetical protein